MPILTRGCALQAENAILLDFATVSGKIHFYPLSEERKDAFPDFATVSGKIRLNTANRLPWWPQSVLSDFATAVAKSAPDPTSCGFVAKKFR